MFQRKLAELGGLEMVTARATARDRQRAERAERERRQRASGDVLRPLSDWWPHYVLELGARDVRPGPVTTYRVAFDKLRAFVGPEAPPACVTPDSIEAWRDHMHRVEGLKPQT